MNIQTEHLDNHTARLTVAVDAVRFDKAKQKAARELSKRYNIPGFRKGKAPYNVLVRYLGEQPIVEDAIEKLGNDLYREVITQSDLSPYGPGSMDDFTLDPEPTYTFTVPLEPVVELGDYRSIRLGFTAPEVTDEDVDKAMRQLQQHYALVEESMHPVKIGDRITADIHSTFIDGPKAGETDETDEDDAADADVPDEGDEYLHRHGAVVDLDPADPPFLPGFMEALVGANAGDTVEFDLTVPEDDEQEDAAGRQVHFTVTVNKVENVTLPELNDDLAARASEDEEEKLDLLGLRVRIRENLERDAERRAESTYGTQVLDKVVEGAMVKYPPAMVDDRIHDMIHDLENNLRQQGISLEDYYRITGKTHQDLHVDYQETAEKSVVRSLVLGSLLEQENVRVTTEQLDQEINNMLAQFGAQAAAFRQFLDTPQQRQSIASNLLYSALMARLVRIGRGEPLDEEAEEAPVAEAAPAEAQSETSPSGAVAENAPEVKAEEVKAEDETADAEADDAPESDDTETQSS